MNARTGPKRWDPEKRSREIKQESKKTPEGKERMFRKIKILVLKQEGKVPKSETEGERMEPARKRKIEKK